MYLFIWFKDIITEKEWNHRVGKRCSAFAFKVKNNQIKLDRISENELNNLKILWADDKCVENLRISAKNHHGGGDVPASGTHTDGSITIVEHIKKLVSVFYIKYMIIFLFFDKSDFAKLQLKL